MVYRGICPKTLQNQWVTSLGTVRSSQAISDDMDVLGKLSTGFSCIEKDSKHLLPGYKACASASTDTWVLSFALCLRDGSSILILYRQPEICFLLLYKCLIVRHWHTSELQKQDYKMLIPFSSISAVYLQKYPSLIFFAVFTSHFSPVLLSYHGSGAYMVRICWEKLRRQPPPELIKRNRAPLIVFWSCTDLSQIKI